MTTLFQPHATDLARILSLAIYDPNWVAPDLTDFFRRPGGTMKLRPIQSKSLYYAKVFRGLMAFVGVGHGKTLLSILLPVILEAERPLLLIPPSQRADLRKQWEVYARHFRLPARLEVQSYEMLSSPDSTGMLTSLRPDLIVCDEAHKLSDKKSARTRRFLRYLQANPDVMFCALSGSFTTRSIKDYQHLSTCALGRNSPLPLKHGEVEDFALALDVERNSVIEGESSGIDFRDVRGLRAQALERLQPLCDAFGSDDIREAYQRRLVSNPGVVVTQEASVDIPVIIVQRSPAVPEAVSKAIAELEGTWRTPAGEELAEVLEFSRVRWQLAQGFFKRWVWPNGIVDTTWMEARQQWFRCVRAFMPHSKEGQDSPALAEKAVLETPGFVPLMLIDAYSTWAQVKDRPQPPTETVWIDPYLVFDSVNWAKQNEPALIWYGDSAVCLGEAIAAVGGFQFADVGPQADALLASIDKPRNLVLSIKAHGTGKNLQLWNNQLVTAPPANGRAWQQLIGRTRRQNQKAELIRCSVNVHVPCFVDALRKARLDAQYIQKTTTEPQILNIASYQ